MPLPIFDKQTDVPKGFEDEYEEQDGKWHPIDRTATLQKALEQEREARKSAEATARKAAKDAADEKARKAATAGGMTEKELKDLYDSIESNLRAEYEPKIASTEKLAKENRELKLDSKVKELFKIGGALDAKIPDFWKLHHDEFDLTSDGKPMVKNEPGKDVARHVQTILKGRSEWVRGTKASGGRDALSTTSPNSNAGLTPGGLTFEDMVKNPAAAIAVANEG